MDKTNHIDHGRQINAALLCGFLIAAIAFSGCSSSLQLLSNWRQENIVIDGSGNEWQRGLYYDKESDIVYSIRNDNDYVYILLKTQERITKMQMMRAGFTIWFDSSGGNDHFFGIRYPLIKEGAQLEFHPGSDDEQMSSILDQVPLELEIVSAKEENVQRFSTLDVPGIRVKIGRSQETLVYELRVPLRKTPQTPFAIGVTSANRIGIGLETKELNRDKMKMGTHPNEGMNGKMPGDSKMKGGKQGGSGYNGGGRQSSGPENKGKPGQLKLWLSVELARTPDAEQKEKK